MVALAVLALGWIGIDSVDVNSIHRIGMATWQLGKTGIEGIDIGSTVIASIGIALAVQH